MLMRYQYATIKLIETSVPIWDLSPLGKNTIICLAPGPLHYNFHIIISGFPIGSEPPAASNELAWAECVQHLLVMLKSMMPSSDGNIFHVTGPFWGESTSYRCIPLTKASDAELWCVLWSGLNKQSSKQLRHRLRRRHAHTVMHRGLGHVASQDSVMNALIIGLSPIWGHAIT